MSSVVAISQEWPIRKFHVPLTRQELKFDKCRVVLGRVLHRFHPLRCTENLPSLIGRENVSNSSAFTEVCDPRDLELSTGRQPRPSARILTRTPPNLDVIMMPNRPTDPASRARSGRPGGVEPLRSWQPFHLEMFSVTKWR